MNRAKQDQEGKLKGIIPRGGMEKRPGQIITVFSSKGGVGKTFVSINLAVSLGQKTGGKVVLVDLDLDFGSAALSLNIIAPCTIWDLVTEIPGLDLEIMENYLVNHRSGIKLLAVNPQQQGSGAINREDIKTVLEILRSGFDFILLDMPSRISEPLEPAFQAANYLFLVTTPEIAALRNIKSCLNKVNCLKNLSAVTCIILNKADFRSELKPGDVEKNLNCRLYGVLPLEQRLASSSLNQGIPVVLLRPRSRISRGFQDLAQRLVVQEKETVFPGNI